MRKRLGVLCAITLLAACGTPGMLTRTDENVTETRAAAQSSMATHSAPPIRAIEHVDGAWLSKKSVAVSATVALPEFFKRNVRFSTGAPLPMSVLLAQVARGNGLTIRLASDVACDTAGDMGRDLRDGRSGPGGSVGHGAGALFQVNCTESGEPAVPLQYQGTLSGLLDTIAHRSGTHWRYRDGVVQFARYVTQTFQIKMMPGSSSYRASVGKASKMKADRGSTDGGGGGTPGGVDLSFNADANVTVASELDYWADLVKTVTDMLSPGGRVTPSVVTSSLVVTDTADVVERVAERTQDVRPGGQVGASGGDLGAEPVAHPVDVILDGGERAGPPGVDELGEGPRFHGAYAPMVATDTDSSPAITRQTLPVPRTSSAPSPTTSVVSSSIASPAVTNSASALAMSRASVPAWTAWTSTVRSTSPRPSRSSTSSSPSEASSGQTSTPPMRQPPTRARSAAIIAPAE